MNSKTVYLLTILLLVFLGAAIGGSSYYSMNLLKKESDKLVELKLTNQILEDQQNALSVSKRSINKYRELDSIARTVLPQDKDQAKAVREIVKISEESGIKLASINFPSSTLGAIQNKPVTSSPSTPTPNPETQVKPVAGIPGVYEMEINIKQEPSTFTSYQNFLDFLAKLEKNRRTAQVTSINVTPNELDRSKITMNMTLKVYIKP